eukprot:SAG11_NODE_671_length_7815_cov_3.408631_4_plen_220_part_00
MTPRPRRSSASGLPSLVASSCFVSLLRCLAFGSATVRGWQRTRDGEDPNSNTKHEHTAAYRAPSSGGKGEAEGVELGETGGVVAVYDTFVGEEEAVELLALGQKLVGKAEARLAAKGEAKPKGTEYMGRATLSSSQEAGRNPSYRAVAQRVSAVVGIKEHPTDTAYFVGANQQLVQASFVAAGVLSRAVHVGGTVLWWLQRSIRTRTWASRTTTKTTDR